MARNRKLCNVVVGCAGGWIAGAIVLADASLAQNITLDGTLGLPGGTLTGPVYTIPQASGRSVDNALLHSFGQFNLENFETANFETLGGITTIFARVTGGLSNIDGQIQAQANLFLINPNGIVFGPNARLDVTGSFVATTADAIDLGGTLFSANPALPLPDDLLTVNPNAFLFNQVPQPITIDRSQFTFSDGQSVVLVGGPINLNGGQISAPNSRVEFTSLAGHGRVGLTIGGNNFFLSPPTAALADVTLTNSANVNVRASGSGSITIHAQNLTLTGGSQINAGLDFNQGAPGSIGNNIVINVAETVRVINESEIANSVFPGANGNGGKITITTGSLYLEEGGRLHSFGFGRGNPGMVEIEARDRVVFRDNARIYTAMQSTAGGIGSETLKGGDVEITANSISINDQSYIITTTFEQGDAGNVMLRAHEVISLEDSQIFSTVEPKAAGNGGTIHLSAPLITLQNSLISARKSGNGNGGDVFVENTGVLDVQAGSRIAAETDGVGDAGNLKIRVSELVRIDGSGSELNFNTSSERLDAGDAGTLTISTPQLLIQNGGRVSARTSGAGDAGRITVTAPESVTVDGAGSGLFFDSLGSGNAQPFEAIKIETGQLVVQNQGQVTVSGTGQGNPGNLVINAGFIFLNNQGSLIAETRSGTGGNIQLQVQGTLLMRFNSLISASAVGAGDGGNVDIQAPDGLIQAILSENSDIVASAEGGSGGRASGTAAGIYGFRQFRDRRTPESDFTASSEFGFDGLLEINTREDPLPEFLPVGFTDPQIAQNCRAVRKPDQTRSEFVVTGRGGLAATPDELLSSDPVEVDLVTRTPDRTAHTRSLPNHGNSTPNLKIVEAQGWMVDRNGDILLVAQASTIHPDPWQAVPHCPTSHHPEQ